MSQSPSVMILAAGLGKRMKMRAPKTLAELGGRPMLFHVLDRVLAVNPKASICIVVGYKGDLIKKALEADPKLSRAHIEFIEQKELKGTGDAARTAMDSAWGLAQIKKHSPVLVLPGDLPLITDALVAQITEPLSKGSALRLLTTVLADPTGYGRVVRRSKEGAVLRIVEDRDAKPRERLICEVALSIYLFEPHFLQAGLRRLLNSNALGEFYLTDLIEQAARAKKRIEVLSWDCPEDLRGVNDPWELAQAAGILNARIVRSWALRGVRFQDLTTTWIDGEVEFAEDVLVGPGCLFSGATRIETGAKIGARVEIRNSTVKTDAVIKSGSVIEDSTIAERASIGPYAHLRPGSHVGKSTKIGNFVELKKSTIGDGTSVAHLSYVGDAEIGNDVNIGCGFVTCNFDGRVIGGERKHKTIIEDGAFVGSDCQTVAPVRVGKGAYVASGSTITQDVEANAMGIARSRQVNKPGYAAKLRKG